ncbi:hypothetical protein CS006_01235 [Bifidobacterium primatium]|uniref:ABC-2 type transporter transmembrane domain-containing protein n=1 Tax=Bifidobacterium primatium TaxID=2045438 RepID=A0A2M9HAK3_9BIFI|nr:ABC transporter permease [Bifidobacterium primatium]PJM73827.1 hypothetical protein CS006_01235 [Bifidobacterium primatium]
MHGNTKRYAKFALPLVVIAVASCFMALLFYPMMNASMKNVPVAILSLDEGATVQGKTVNIGDTLVDKVTEAASDSDGEPAIAWHEVDSQRQVDDGFDNRDYYAAVVIPKDFTAKQMDAKQAAAKTQIESATKLAQVMAQAQAKAQIAAQQQGFTGAAAQRFVQKAAQEAVQKAVSTQQTATTPATAAPEIKLVVDNAKSPMLANLLRQSLPVMLEKTGATVKTTVLNEGGVTTNSSLPTATMMGQNVLIMPVYMMSLIVSLLVANQLRRKSYDSRAQRWGSFGTQLGLALVWSLGVALGADCIFAMLGSGWLSASMVMFLWLASFALMTVFLGLMNIAVPLGLGCGVLGLGLGMTSGLFPAELLPAFWRDWIYGWVPQHFIGDGVRAVMYRGDGWWNAGSMPLLAVLCVGLLVFVCAGMMPVGRHKVAATDSVAE